MSLRRFQLLRRLPTPAPEETWSARMLWPDGYCRGVAVTLMPPRRDGFAAARERARRLGWLGVRSIPALVDVVGLAGWAAAVVDHADGVDLQRLLARGPLPRRVALELLAGVAGTLGAAWSRAPFAGESPLREAHGALDPTRVWVDPSGRLRVSGFAALRLDAADVDPTRDRAALAAMIRAVQGDRPVDAAVDAALAGLAQDGADLLDIAGLLRRAAWASEGESLAEWAEREVQVEPATAIEGTWVEEPLDEADLDPQLLDLPPELGPPPPLVFARPSVADDTSLDEFSGPRPRRRTVPPGASTFGPPPGTSSPAIPRPAPLRLGAGSGQPTRAAPRAPVPLALRAPTRRGRASLLGGVGLYPIDAQLPAAIARPLPVRVGGDAAELGDPRPPEATPSDPTPGAALPAARRPLPGEGEPTGPTAPRSAAWLLDHDPPTSPTDPLNDRPPAAADLRAVLASDPGPILRAVAEAPPEGELSLDLDPPSSATVAVPAAADLRPLPVAAAPEEPERSMSIELDDVSRSLSIELDEVSVSLSLEDTSHSDRVGPPPMGGAEEGTEELSSAVPVDDPAEAAVPEPIPETGDRPTQAIADNADIEPTVRMAVTPTPTGFLAARLAAAVDEVSVPRAAEEPAEPTLDVDPSVARDLAAEAPSPAAPPASTAASLFDAPTAEFVVEAEASAAESPTPGRTLRPVEVRTVQFPPVAPVAPAVAPAALAAPAPGARPPAVPPRPRLQPVPPPSAAPVFLKGALSVLGVLVVLGGAVLAWHWALAPLLRPVEVGGP